MPLRRDEHAPLSVSFLLQTFLPEDSVAQPHSFGSANPCNSSSMPSGAPSVLAVSSSAGGDFRSQSNVRKLLPNPSLDLGAGLFGNAGERCALEAVLRAVEEVGRLTAVALHDMDSGSRRERLLTAAKDNAPQVCHL